MDTQGAGVLSRMVCFVTKVLPGSLRLALGHHISCFQQRLGDREAKVVAIFQARENVG